ncbi:MAG: PEP/pyruvate-binding domain-containing protein [Desulfococcaceae bacterium]|nr:PEP/pyruvate-binding domain-containing protein [Desulfococcaceae bacterium]
MIQSKALEANIASYHVDVEPDPGYDVIREVMSKYYGLTEGIVTFLKEISHPQKNLPFIVNEARNYCLNYFHLLRNHPSGPEAAELFADIFINVIESAQETELQRDAADNLLLFLQKIIRESGSSRIGLFLPVLNTVFRRIRNFDDRIFFLFVSSYYRMEKAAADLMNYGEGEVADFREIRRLLFKYYQFSYSYWMSETDPLPWFEGEANISGNREQLAEIFDPVSHRFMEETILELSRIRAGMPASSDESPDLYQLRRLLALPAYNRIADNYREIPRRLRDAAENRSRGNRWKVIFLFHIMNISGLSLIHEETLRDINRTMSWLIQNEKHLNIEILLTKAFSVLRARTQEFPTISLSCVLNMGKGIYKTDDSDLIKLFIDELIDMGFHSPMISGVGNDWQIRVNPAHIRNIRTWLELIELHPRYSTRLLSVLIIHLSFTGVFIKDTDLFPRDITRLLNSNIRPVYNLVKQLTRLFPVFFNDIGAEGDLRDISTQIDEISHRKDLLVHFLRKQIHVESSNRVVAFTEALLRFWLTADKSCVEPFVPPSIYEQIDEKGPCVRGVNRVLRYLKEHKAMVIPEYLLEMDTGELKWMMNNIGGEAETDKERVVLAAQLYRLLHQKYNPVMGDESFHEIESYLSRLRTKDLPDPAELRQSLEEADVRRKLPRLLEHLETLRELILSERSFEIREDIYKKRHFTVDIPSMYGSYHEMKFDALGLTFRIESVINICFEEIVEGLDLNLITRETFYHIYDLLKLFDRALKLDGISSAELGMQLELLRHALKTRGFTFTQYLDVFKGFARAVNNIISDYFNNVHENNMKRVLNMLPLHQIQDRYISPEDAAENEKDREKIRHKASEIFFREKIALSLGLQQLDLLLSRILKTLFHQSFLLPDDKLRLLLNYDPQRAMVSVSEAEEKANGIIHLGNKGHNLVRLNRKGFPVPPGFIITTEVFRCRYIIENYQPADRNFKKQVETHIGLMERRCGKRFGDPANPLLFSVRSGSSISQPGMMDTFLNVGMNEKIAEGLAGKTGNGWFAWDNYRRFVQCYGMAHGLHRDDFDAIIFRHKAERGITFKRAFTGEEMKKLALDYKAMVRDAGIRIPEEPFEQLLRTITIVLNSWESEKARTYRKIIGISDDWGTAVTVQNMVYGNLSRESGSGVVFTHNPKWSEDNVRLWGDFTIGNQGEDVVSGLVNTLPVSIIQQDNELRDTDITLETHFSHIFNRLKEWATELIYKRGWSPQEIEFTFEGPEAENLWLLQSRNMSIRQRKKVYTFDPDSMNDNQLLGNGIGVSGGAMSGRAVFTLEEIESWQEKEKGTSLILIRGDTVPDDIKEINAADGILTARGGVTSHAAVVAHRLGKTCVVGCGNLFCLQKDGKGIFENVKKGEEKNIVIRAGDYISIDGQKGHIYLGAMKVKEA